MKSYSLAEVFASVQGEGLRAGRASVFARFAGCNLWNGREAGRASGAGACAEWCDTDFLPKMRRTAGQLLEELDTLWGEAMAPKWVVLTGGEPTLQLDASLLETLAGGGWWTAVETNGTTACSEVLAHCDHVCLSPKRGSDWATLDPSVVTEVKVVLAGDDWSPADLALMERTYPTAALFVQPIDPGRAPDAVEVLGRSVGRCLDAVRSSHRWTLSVQAHKAIGLR